MVAILLKCPSFPLLTDATMLLPMLWSCYYRYCFCAAAMVQLLPFVFLGRHHGCVVPLSCFLELPELASLITSSSTPCRLRVVAGPLPSILCFPELICSCRQSSEVHELSRCYADPLRVALAPIPS
ncbi:hypothetical protein CDL15_Pgr027260 [Punica granatum]|uniref:Uncharacterized protein n=1 Tax=Punica granatum TaxID=22663 RepID=A0A218XM97_PUNGR|nr:hypothetical protein CDL15_Pgr027260 [Punica granatum]PKH99241.1 hypothetical protein CRG98_049665 [Punica granatum]